MKTENVKIHELKIKDEYLTEIECGNKQFELRKNDRNYKAGDLIHFTCVDNPKHININNFRINYVLQNCDEYGLKDGYCILSI